MEFRTNGNKATIGITVLGAISAFSVWSACNPSLFTVAQFTTEQSKKNARFGMKVGVALNALLGAGIYLAYGKKGLFPAVLTTATGVGLYFLYEHMLNKVNTTNPSGQDMNQQHQGFRQSVNLQTGQQNDGGGGNPLGSWMSGIINRTKDLTHPGIRPDPHGEIMEP